MESELPAPISWGVRTLILFSAAGHLLSHRNAAFEHQQKPLKRSKDGSNLHHAATATPLK